MVEQTYYDALKAGLEDAVAFINGNQSRGRILRRESHIPNDKAEDVAKTRLKIFQKISQTPLNFSSDMPIE